MDTVLFWGAGQDSISGHWQSLWYHGLTNPASVAFTLASDSSYITHWLSWEDATVRWVPVDAGRTRVTWTLRYRRRLDPAWYFVPLERYGARLAAAYLVETLATPRTPVAR